MAKPKDCACEACGLTQKPLGKCPNQKTYAKAVKDSKDSYRRDPFVRDAMTAHSRLLDRGGSRWPRVKHLSEYCLAAGVTRVGLAACVMFLPEARFLKTHLAEAGISSVVTGCKIGALGLKDLGVDRELSYEYTSCNPAAQAFVCNERNTELNVIMGLCLGHDIIFNNLSQAPVTTLFVKEHISKHCPYKTIRKMMEEKDSVGENHG